MLQTFIPFSIAHCRPRAKTGPRPRRRGPRTRTLYSSQSGASERMIPAQAVPWPNVSSCGSVLTVPPAGPSTET